jgi:hypothetical protein
MLAVAGTLSGFDIEFPAVPGTSDMQIGFAEPHPLISLVGGDHFLNAVDQQTVTDRPALMRADIEESVKLAFGANDANLAALVFHRVAAALSDIRRTRNENFSHHQSFSLCWMDIYGLISTAQLRISVRAMSGIESGSFRLPPFP